MIAIDAERIQKYGWKARLLCDKIHLLLWGSKLL